MPFSFNIEISFLPHLSSPTKPAHETCAPKYDKFSATFPAPPSEEKLFFGHITGTGASGDSLDDEPKSIIINH